MDKKFYGLTDKEVKISHEKYGKNTIILKRQNSIFAGFLQNLKDPIIKILICALVVTVILPGNNGIYESLGILLAIIISVMVSTLSEYGSEKAFRKMQEEASTVKCKVMRNGKEKSIDISEIAVGDLVYLTSGDRIPADGYIIFGGISCDQSALNGEITEFYKTVSDDKSKDALSKSYLLRGVNVTAGYGVMEVDTVGDSTFYGKMASELQSVTDESPLRKKLSGLAKTLSKFGYICAFLVGISELIYSFFIDKSFVFNPYSVFSEFVHALTLGVSVIVMAVPEGLPMMITVVLSSNMLRMQKCGVQVRKAVGIETAGSMNILFTDKTGTLTEGKPSCALFVSGDGEKALKIGDFSENLRNLTALCGKYASESSEKQLLGNETDKVIFKAFLDSGVNPKGVQRENLLPFNSDYKLSCAYCNIKNPKIRDVLGNSTTFVKGAPENILKYCKYYYTKDGKAEKCDCDFLEKELEKLMSKGMRVMAMATSGVNMSQLSSISDSYSKGQKSDISPIFSDMKFICFVCIKDSLRREAPKAVATLKGAGIQVVMITGDSRITAVSIAKECGIIDLGVKSNYVIDSEDLAKMDDKEVIKILPSLKVVARALPSDKTRLVRIAKSMGLITAMTGDGLNDAPALKNADVGFAMGNGTEVAKESSDIIISDSNINSVTKAVLYGRTVFRSIRKFIVFQLTMNLCAVGISIVGPFISCESPVTVMQMLWINLIIDTFAALAFSGEAPADYYMKEKPLPPGEPVLNSDMITRIFVMGIFTFMLCLYYFNSSFVKNIFWSGENDVYFLSGFFALFVFTGIFGAFNARSQRLNLFSGLFVNPLFVFVMALVFTVQLFLIYRGGEIFRCAPLNILQLKTVILLSFTVIIAGRILELLLKIGTSENKNPISEKLSDMGKTSFAG